MVPCTISASLTECSVHMCKYQARALERDQGELRCASVFLTQLVFTYIYIVGLQPVSYGQM